MELTTDPLHVTYPRPNAAVAAFCGEHDLSTKTKTGQILAELVVDNDLIVVDLSETTFIDSSFLHNLVVAHDLAGERGSELRLVLRGDGIVRNALKIAGLVDVFTVSPTREEALSSADGKLPR